MTVAVAAFIGGIQMGCGLASDGVGDVGAEPAVDVLTRADVPDVTTIMAAEDDNRVNPLGVKGVGEGGVVGLNAAVASAVFNWYTLNKLSDGVDLCNFSGRIYVGYGTPWTFGGVLLMARRRRRGSDLASAMH